MLQSAGEMVQEYTGSLILSADEQQLLLVVCRQGFVVCVVREEELVAPLLIDLLAQASVLVPVFVRHCGEQSLHLVDIRLQQ